MGHTNLKDRCLAFIHCGKHLLNIITKINPLKKTRINTKHNVNKNNRETEVFTVCGPKVELFAAEGRYFLFNYPTEDKQKTKELEVFPQEINLSNKRDSMDAVKLQKEKDNNENIWRSALDKMEKYGNNIAEIIRKSENTSSKRIKRINFLFSTESEQNGLDASFTLCFGNIVRGLYILHFILSVIHPWRRRREQETNIRVSKKSIYNDASAEQNQNQNTTKKLGGNPFSEKISFILPNQRAKTFIGKKKERKKRNNVRKRKGKSYENRENHLKIQAPRHEKRIKEKKCKWMQLQAIFPFLTIQKLLLWILLISVILCKHGDASMDCGSAIKQSVLEVPLCSSSQKEWENASILCKSYQDSCIEELKFHCALNADGTKFVQVCAPNTKITQTFCPEYNSGIKRIQPHQRIVCKACAVSYDSSEGYKHPECLNKSILKNFNEETTVPKIDSSTPIALNHTPPVTGNQSIQTNKESLILFRVLLLSFNAALNLLFLVIAFRCVKKGQRDVEGKTNYGSYDSAPTVIVVEKTDNE